MKTIIKILALFAAIINLLFCGTLIQKWSMQEKYNMVFGLPVIPHSFEVAIFGLFLLSALGIIFLVLVYKESE